MIERRDRKNGAGTERANPGEIYERIGFVVGVANRAIRLGRNRLRANRLLLGRVRHLVEIVARGSDQPQLIVRSRIKNQRAESADAVAEIVDDLRHGSFERRVGTVDIDASVVGKTLRVASQIDLAVGLVVAAIGCENIDVVVTFKTGARNYVENTEGSVAVIGRITAALDFEIVDVLRIESAAPRLLAILVFGTGTPSISQLT